jgi:hypothetical protein
MRFIICLAAPIAQNPRHMAAMRERIRVPSLHIIGQQDWLKAGCRPHPRALAAIHRA